VPLSLSATKEQLRARLREEELGSDLVGVPAWNILIELFKQFAGGAKVSTKSIQIISGCPETTALRIIGRLEDQGIVKRSHCDSDKRVTYVSLTKTGVLKVGTLLERLEG
jgi:DNA-binding MarR family transcriptional regulator